MDDTWESFRAKLDEHHAWPELYTFKFIAPLAKADAVRALFPDHDVHERASRNGNYISFTIQMMASGSDAVIRVYQKVGTVEGVIAL